MSHETCPLLDDLSWIRHGFYDRSHPVVNSDIGVLKFNDEFSNALFLKQTHSAIVIDENGDTSSPADASFTAQSGLALVAKTADCCPILLACTHSKQIAAVHAGREGALKKITSATIARMIENGAKANAIIAAIGPSIHVCDYPVMDDIRQRFIETDPQSALYFEPFEDRWKLNVIQMLQDELKSNGVEKVWVSATNTFTSPSHFSYRRRDVDPTSENNRNVSIIAISPLSL